MDVKTSLLQNFQWPPQFFALLPVRHESPALVVSIPNTLTQHASQPDPRRITHIVKDEDCAEEDVDCFNLVDPFTQLITAFVEDISWALDEISGTDRAQQLATIDDSTLAYIKAQMAADTLSFNGVTLTRCHVEQMANMPFLTDLTLENCNLQDSDLEPLKRVVLRSLTLSSNRKITGECLKFLPPSIKALALEDCALSNASTRYLARIENLYLLNLAGNPNILGTHFDKLPASLVELNVSGCNCGDFAIKQLKHLDYLYSLAVSKNRKITGETFISLPRSLAVLIADHCSLQDRHVAQLMYHSSLKELNVSANPHVTGEHFYFLAESLKALDCSSCTISHVTFPASIEKLSCTTLLTAADKMQIVERCPSLDATSKAALNDIQDIKNDFGTTGRNLLNAFQHKLETELNTPAVKFSRQAKRSHVFTIHNSKNYTVGQLQKILDKTPSCLLAGTGWKITLINDTTQSANKVFRLDCVSSSRYEHNGLTYLVHELAMRTFSPMEFFWV